MPHVTLSEELSREEGLQEGRQRSILVTGSGNDFRVVDPGKMSASVLPSSRNVPVPAPSQRSRRAEIKQYQELTLIPGTPSSRLALFP